VSTGDRTILGRLSKRGNGYLRMLFMQAARVILLRLRNWPKHNFEGWLVGAAQRLHPNVFAAALANKLARIAWAVLAQQRSYEARVSKAAAWNDRTQVYQRDGPNGINGFPAEVGESE
jgi:transposase